MATTPPDKNIQQPSYLIVAATAASTTTTTTTTTVLNGGNDTPALCDIKILCTQRKKKNKHYNYLTFVETRNLSSTNEQPCIEITGKTDSTSILLNECISYEYFDEIKNDFQSFIYIYFQSYTISIYFSDEHIEKKSLIVKHLEYMYKQKSDQPTEMNTNPPLAQELPNITTTENIIHTFDVKLIPHESIITRDHILIGPARIYFTTTDLFIAPRDCNRIDLKTTITSQCPSKDKNILCIPYFTIKHYGNRSNIFLIELGKSNYGNGEIHMKCHSSSLASTIHLLASPVIEERPLMFSSAFQNQLLTNKRIEKSRDIHPPIQLHKDTTDSLLPFIKKHSIESLPEQSTKTNLTKSHSVFGLIRKLLKNKNSLERSTTFDANPTQPLNISPPLMNKFFELNIDEKKFSNDQNLPPIPIPNHTIPLKPQPVLSNRQETTIGTYIDMGPTIPKVDQIQQEEIKDEEVTKEPRTTVDIGVNTIISLSPHVHSAIIVGTTVHLIAEERTVLPPIGQRSFTSPASVMQPFKAQLTGQSTINSNIPTTDMIECTTNNSNSYHQSTNSSNPHQSLLLAYSFVTINNNPLSTDQPTYFSDSSTIDRRLNSDLSLMSTSHQQQPSNIYSLDNILSSSTSSQIFRTLSFPTNNLGDNTSGRIRTSQGSIIFFDENYVDQSTTTYLLEQPRIKFVEDTNLPCLSPVNIPTSSNINEEQRSTNDAYALIEPLDLENSSSSLSSLTPILTKPLEKSVNYTEVTISTNTGDEQNELDLSDDNNQLNDLTEERNDRSSTIFYTDIDFHQTQRRDRIAQFAAMSKIKDQIPPFVL